MPTIFKELIDALTKNLGGVRGYMAKQLLKYGGQLLINIWKKYVQEKKQKEATDKVIEDIKQAKPRDEEVKKNEKEFINS